MPDRKQIFGAARSTASNQIQVFFPTIKPRIFPLIVLIETNFVNKEKKFVIFNALGNSLEVIILALFNKTF